MAVDIIDLTRFYETALGRHVAARLQDELAAIWPRPATARDAVLAYGFGPPLAQALWPEAAWHYLMPSQQGALPQADGACILSHEQAWPVRDDSINRLLLLHGLEAATRPESLMQEVHRILVPNGRAMFVVSNRRGLWARSDRTPFGTGRPYSAGQLRQLLRQNGLVPGLARPALLAPPSLSHMMPRSLRPFGRVMAAVLPHLAGVWVMEAVKQVPAPLSVTRAMNKRRLAAVRPAVVSPKI